MTWLGWSSPGLAKHKRSLLAVLTSNHLLSLWASNSDMRLPESWERVLIVNYAAKIENLDRIQSACWIPTWQHGGKEPQFLAVGDESAGLVVLRVSSPFTDSPITPGWEVSFVKHCPMPVQEPSIDSFSLYRSHSENYKTIESIWSSSWMGGEEGLRSVLLISRRKGKHWLVS